MRQPSPFIKSLNSSLAGSLLGTDNTMRKTWSDLPPELVAAIAERLTSHADHARFRSVCPSWRSASAEHAARRRVPLLLLPSQDGSRRSRRVWYPADDSLGEIPLPAGRGRSFLFGSTRGWTLGVSADLSSVTLVDPYTGASADLPPLPFPFRGGGERGVVVPRDVVWDWSPRGVVVSPGKGAFFCRPGDGSWSPVSVVGDDDLAVARVTSVTYCDGAFYLFDGATRKTLAVDAATFGEVDVTVIDPPPQLEEMRTWSSWRRYEANLAVDVSSDELLLLVRTQLLHPVCSGWSMDKKFFKAFRRSCHGGGGGGIWSEVTDIGDRAVLVDHFRAFCVEVNGRNGLRRNCMYVASSYEEVNDDYGMDVFGKYTATVLDLADLETVELSRGRGNLSKVWCSEFWQWPSWSMPNLY